jgi:hypothetical protein
LRPAAKAPITPYKRDAYLQNIDRNGRFSGWIEERLLLNAANRWVYDAFSDLHRAHLAAMTMAMPARISEPVRAAGPETTARWGYKSSNRKSIVALSPNIFVLNVSFQVAS